MHQIKLKIIRESIVINCLKKFLKKITDNKIFYRPNLANLLVFFVYGFIASPASFASSSTFTTSETGPQQFISLAAAEAAMRATESVNQATAGNSDNLVFEIARSETDFRRTRLYSILPINTAPGPWDYGYNRCRVDRYGFNTEQKAVEAGMWDYYYYCGDPEIERSSGWGTVSKPTKGACGSRRAYPRFSRSGIEVINTNKYKIRYCSFRDGLTIYRRRNADDCPKAYTLTRDENNDLVCINKFTATITEHLNQYKSLGCPGESAVGNPCNASNGNKYQREIDYQGYGNELSIIRSYNSLNAQDKHMGFGWLLNLTPKLEISTDQILVLQTNGRAEAFSSNNGVWQGDADTHLTLTADSTGYTLESDKGSIERYDLSGRIVNKADLSGKQTLYRYNADQQLVGVTGPFGHELQFSYNNDNRIESVTTPDGEFYQYLYDIKGNLTKVIYPDTTFKQYHYENSSYPHALTGITDANGDRFSTYSYNADGKAITTEHAITTNTTAQEHFDLSYDSNTQTTVTDAAGTVEVLTFAENLGVKNLQSRINQSDGKGIQRSYDANNNLLSHSDAEGKLTRYSYNAANQRIRIIEASGTREQRTTDYHYLNEQLDLPVQISSPSVVNGKSKQTLYTYNSNHTIQSNKVNGFRPDGTAISRTMHFEYNRLGQLSQINGAQPGNQDTTLLSYYDCSWGAECGQLAQIRNALGQVTRYNQYDASGRLLHMTAPNGLISQYQYDSRGRVIRFSQTPPQEQGQPRISQYQYDNAGQLLTVIQPDGLQLNYRYDAAHDLRSVTDNLGNQVNYYYDAKGNRTRTETQNANGDLLTAVELAYDQRNRIQSINNAGFISEMLYDATGNLLTEIDANQNPATEHNYDGLSRLRQTLDALGNITDNHYNNQDQLIQVKAPSNATTVYRYDDFGNLLQEHSPDRGNTDYKYNNAGNLIQRTDARGITAQYQYDALNRVLAVNYPGDDEDINYHYDNCSNGIGRLCIIEDSSGRTEYQYDSYGNLTQQLKIDAGQSYRTAYRYDAANRIISVTYPNGRIVDYQRDALGRISQISSKDKDKTLIFAEQIQYRGDGLLNALNYGNGILESRSYDAAGRLNCIETDNLPNRCYQYDANSNIIQRQTQQNHDYSYDVINRLLQEDTGYNRWQYNYEANGNRLSRVDDQAANDYHYQDNSNRLKAIDQGAIELDAAGNTLSDHNGKRRFEYNPQGRLFKVYHKNKLKAVYTYNALGQRTAKDLVNKGKTKTTRYHYDQNGQLLAETRANGKFSTDYIWLNDRPVAQIKSKLTRKGKLKTANIIYLHTDHLNTPRTGTNKEGETVWQWHSDAFGNALEVYTEDEHDELDDDDKKARGEYTHHKKAKVNLRFPGQYFDRETGLFYNYQRYYDPSTGRYITSDPIGLAGGLNTYAYVGGNPVKRIDPLGLYDVFIGGGGDSSSGIVRNYQSSFSRAHPSRLTDYFQWGEQSEIVASIQNAMTSNPCESINLIGHSYGGATAANVAESLAEKGMNVNLMVTVDPVSRWWSMSDNAGNVDNWVNIHAAPKKSNGFSGDAWATLGGRWADWPKDRANIHYTSPYHHNEFGNMMGYIPSGGTSALQTLLNSECSCK